MKKLRTLAEGLPKEQSKSKKPSRPCAVCQKGKQVLKINRRPQQHATQKLELIHSDLGDLSKEKKTSLGGSKYFMLFIDDYTRYTWVYFLKTKSKEEVLHAFRDFKALVEKQMGLPIKRFRCDNGRGEFNNAEFKQFLRTKGINNEPAPSY